MDQTVAIEGPRVPWNKGTPSALLLALFQGALTLVQARGVRRRLGFRRSAFPVARLVDLLAGRFVAAANEHFLVDEIACDDGDYDDDQRAH